MWKDRTTGTYYGINKTKVQLTETIRGKETLLIKSENVLATARKYYGCDTMTGMQLENDVILPNRLIFNLFFFKLLLVGWRFN